MSKNVISGLEVADFGRVSHEAGHFGTGDVEDRDIIGSIISHISITAGDVDRPRICTHAGGGNLDWSRGIGDVHDRKRVSSLISHIGIAAGDEDTLRTCSHSNSGSLNWNRGVGDINDGDVV